MEFLVKVYFPTKKYRTGGKMSQHLFAMKIGDCIEAYGPLGKIIYSSLGSWILPTRTAGGNSQGDGTTAVAVNNAAAAAAVREDVREVIMVAGGTGIAPMFQILNQALNDPEDLTRFALVFANHAESDILLRRELDLLLAQHPDRLRLRYCLSHPSSSWIGCHGYVNSAKIAETIFDPKNTSSTEAVATVEVDPAVTRSNSASPTRLALVCGPPDFERQAAYPALKQLGFSEMEILSF
eukprot:TRINITY_DN13031_c4_g1_i2.p1 TRINITY_DN13031_c4_g1~~TRINITY_DN13031_c4_g1_i2.p1  ORF type:complete len:238 (+),score=37.55 TRINITY_DN13031_c4_g1_i2:261-974(+)